MTAPRLSRRAHRAALIAHLLASVGWFGVAVLVAVCGLASISADAELARSIYRTMEFSLWVSVPFGLLSLATGLVLSFGTVWGVLRHWWLVVKLGINVAVMVTDLVVVGPAVRIALAAGGPPHRLYDATIAHVLALTVAVVLSVVKPRGRTPLGRRRLAESATATLTGTDALRASAGRRRRPAPSGRA